MNKVEAGLLGDVIFAFCITGRKSRFIFLAKFASDCEASSTTARMRSSIALGRWSRMPGPNGRQQNPMAVEEGKTAPQ
jgi:hypothetical protein